MKLYLAAPYAGREILKGELPFWEDLGAEITCGWVKGTRPLGASTYGISIDSTDDEVTAHANMDLEDIDKADAVVQYTANYLRGLDPSLHDQKHNLHSGGRHVEVGYALAREKPVLILGESENIFQRGLCLQAYSPPEAVEALRLYANLAQ